MPLATISITEAIFGHEVDHPAVMGPSVGSGQAGPGDVAGKQAEAALVPTFWPSMKRASLPFSSRSARKTSSPKKAIRLQPRES